MAWVLRYAEDAVGVVDTLFYALEHDALVAVDDIDFAPLEKGDFSDTITSKQVATAIFGRHAVARYAHDIVGATLDKLWYLNPLAIVVHNGWRCGAILPCYGFHWEQCASAVDAWCFEL